MSERPGTEHKSNLLVAPSSVVSIVGKIYINPNPRLIKGGVDIISVFICRFVLVLVYDFGVNLLVPFIISG